MTYLLIVTVQMILSAVLGVIHGGVLGYFVTAINLFGLMMETIGFGYYLNERKHEKEKEKEKENKQNEPELG